MQRFTVTSLTDELKRVLESRYPALEVEGEVGHLTVAASGHAYLTLRDERAQLNCVCWSSTWRGLSFQPERGARVVCRGKLGVYGGKGAYQLYVHAVSPAGEGALAAELARRKARLEADGLLDPRRKRALPSFPRVVGVATSATGAALQDFLEVSRRRHPATRILVSPCQVQGEGAPGSIVQAVDLLLEDGRSEVIVVTRGGGSKEDLLAFQDEGLARFLAASPIPVVSVVGHQIDTTLSDLVADAVAPTPSAAAIAVLPDGPALAQRVDDAAMGLDASTRRVVARHRERVVAARARLRHPSERLRAVRTRADELWGRAERAMGRVLPPRRRDVASTYAELQRTMQHLLERDRERVGAAAARAEALSPQAVLARGYAVVVGPTGVVTQVDQAPAGSHVSVTVADGRFGATVDADPVLGDEGGGG